MRLLPQYALELEAKIRDCSLAADKTFFILCLCGEGVPLAPGWARRFRGDPFSKVETKHRGLWPQDYCAGSRPNVEWERRCRLACSTRMVPTT